MNSLSSSLILGTTLYRNQPGISNKLIAQVGYALAAVVAAVETVASLAFSAASLAFLPFSSAPLSHSLKWVNSSAFSIGWAVADFALNLFVRVLVADERSARAILENGDLMRFPQGALLYVQERPSPR